MERAEAAEGAAWLQWREVAKKKHTKEKSKEEREVNEDDGERIIRSQIAQEVVAGIKEKVSVHDGDMEAVQRPAGRRVTRNWDVLQIENEEEDVSWREGDQMAARAKSGGDRGIEGNSLKLVVMQKVPGLVVQERMSQGEGVKGLKDKKRKYTDGLSKI